jgi:hypothetical protein
MEEVKKRRGEGGTSEREGDERGRRERRGSGMRQPSISIRCFSLYTKTREERERHCLYTFCLYT